MARTSSRLPADSRLRLSVTTLTRALLAIAALLTVVSLVSQVIAHTFDLKPERLSFSFFNVDAERNIPTTFQAALFLGCAILLACIAAIKSLLGDRWRRYWSVLALVFVGLAWDEITEIHEHLIHLLRPFGLSGIFYFAWIVPAAVALSVFGAAYLRFLIALPNPLRNRVVVGGTLFLTAVFPLEAVGGWYFERLGEQANIRYVFLTTAEEALEMAGLIIFLRALGLYLASLLTNTTLSLAGRGGELVVVAERVESSPARAQTERRHRNRVAEAAARHTDANLEVAGDHE